MQNISPFTLNVLLIPTFLQGLSNCKISEFIDSDNIGSNILKNQVLRFYGKMKLSKQYSANRKIYSYTSVEWTTSNSLIISQSLLTEYFNFATTTSNHTGFVFILVKIFDHVKKAGLYRQMQQDGKISLPNQNPLYSLKNPYITKLNSYISKPITKLNPYISKPISKLKKYISKPISKLNEYICIDSESDSDSDFEFNFD
jgi:hypothetical protein